MARKSRNEMTISFFLLNCSETGNYAFSIKSAGTPFSSCVVNLNVYFNIKKGISKKKIKC